MKDAADAFIHFFQNKIDGIFNIGMEQSFSPADFAQMIEEHTSTQSYIVQKQTNNTLNKQEVLSVEKAKMVAHWSARWKLQQALSDFWKESKKHQ